MGEYFSRSGASLTMHPPKKGRGGARIAGLRFWHSWHCRLGSRWTSRDHGSAGAIVPAGVGQFKITVDTKSDSSVADNDSGLPGHSELASAVLPGLILNSPRRCCPNTIVIGTSSTCDQDTQIGPRSPAFDYLVGSCRLCFFCRVPKLHR